MKKLIKSSRIYGEGGLMDGAILVEGGKIASLFQREMCIRDRGNVIQHLLAFAR